MTGENEVGARINYFFKDPKEQLDNADNADGKDIYVLTDNDDDILNS